MTIEILFPEICNLYGDSGNVLFIEKNFPNAQIIKTKLNEEPYFINNKVNFIYMGPMTEKNSIKVCQKLLPYKERIKKLLDEKVIFLFVGNAVDIMGEKIKTNDGNEIKGLEILELTSTNNLATRYNSLFLGSFSFESHPIVGYKSQSSEFKSSESPLFTVIKEKNNEKQEGVLKNNFFGTNLLGPILILNPYFTKYLFSLLGYKKKLYLEKELIEAYEERVKEYQNAEIKY